MLNRQTKIIAIDNNPEHLSILTDRFHKNGIGCLPILYDQLNPPEMPFTNVRLAFFDINLRDITNEIEIFNDLTNALNEYIHKDNGPYALIFWTQNKRLILDLTDYISQRRPETPRPYLINCIDKDIFLSDSEISLDNCLSNIFSSPQLNLLLDFEERAQEAASMTINNIYNLIPNNDNWGNNELFEFNFDLIFSKIAISAIGYQHAKKNPDKAIYEALSPTVANLLINLNTDTKWKGLLKSLTNSTHTNQPKYPDQFETSKLNSIFHLDTNSMCDYNRRGAVIEYIFMPKNATKFNYFEELNSQSNELFSKFIQFDNKVIDEQKRNRIIGNSKFIVIEISSSCDYSQNKYRNNKYILSLITPLFEFKLLNSNNMSESIFYKDLPVINYKNKDFLIWINFNISFSDFERNQNFGNVLFTFRKEIMDMIGNRYANHVSRIGITSF